MIHSMTGFGRASVAAEGVAFDIEVRSVNHRYLDVRIRLPRLLSVLETAVCGRLQERFARGKVDLSVVTPEGSTPSPRLEVDLEAAREYLRASRVLCDEEGVAGELDVSTLLALPGVSRFVETESLDERLRSRLLGGVDEAVAAVAEMRATEGATLARDLGQRLDHVAKLAENLEERSSVVRDAVRARLEKRTEQLAREAGSYDAGRLQQEIVMAADRMDVTEEIVRLRSHVEQFRSTLDAGGPGKPVGRRLDFLLQELGREANTIGSKAGDAPVAHTIVELKTELERLREQVQNVE